ncbi:MAG: hypothetical protein ACREMY_15550, partial [bacterium]
MSEQLFDLYSSTLASNYTPASGTLIVTSASGLPSAGDFSLTILDQTTLAVKLVFKVISRSGTTLTGAPESNDIAAVTGDIVVGSMLTTRSLPSLLSEYDQYGPFASLPTSPRAGYRYKPTDTAFTEMIYDGSPLAWHYFVGAKEVTPP